MAEFGADVSYKHKGKGTASKARVAHNEEEEHVHHQ